MMSSHHSRPHHSGFLLVRCGERGRGGGGLGLTAGPRAAEDRRCALHQPVHPIHSPRRPAAARISLGRHALVLARGGGHVLSQVPRQQVAPAAAAREQQGGGWTGSHAGGSERWRGSQPPPLPHTPSTPGSAAPGPAHAQGRVRVGQRLLRQVPLGTWVAVGGPAREDAVLRAGRALLAAVQLPQVHAPHPGRLQESRLPPVKLACSGGVVLGGSGQVRG